MRKTETQLCQYEIYDDLEQIEATLLKRIYSIQTVFGGPALLHDSLTGIGDWQGLPAADFNKIHPIMP